MSSSVLRSEGVNGAPIVRVLSGDDQDLHPLWMSWLQEDLFLLLDFAFTGGGRVLCGQTQSGQQSRTAQREKESSNRGMAWQTIMSRLGAIVKLRLA